MSYMRLFLVSLIIAAFTTGCAGMKDWEFAQMKCCQKGALAGMAAGASTGAIIGYQSREEGEGAAVGAVAGAVIGGIMGKLLCKAEVLDSDGDGVPDDLDRCPNTPQGVLRIPTKTGFRTIWTSAPIPPKGFRLTQMVVLRILTETGSMIILTSAPEHLRG